MPFSLPDKINYLDVVLLAILVLFTARGLYRGFLDEVTGLVGLVLGIYVAGRYYEEVGRRVAGFFQDAAWTYVVAYVLIVCVAMLGTALVANVLQKVLSVACAAWLNNLAGAVAGSVKGFLICAVLVWLLQYFLAGAPFVRESRMVPPIQEATLLLKGAIPEGFMDRVRPPQAK